MPFYGVLVNGENFLMSVGDGGLKRMGFYATRYVRAESVELAETAAIDEVRAIEHLRDAIQNTRQDPPRLHIEEMHEISALPESGVPEPGITFYVEDEDDERDERPEGRPVRAGTNPHKP